MMSAIVACDSSSSMASKADWKWGASTLRRSRLRGHFSTAGYMLNTSPADSSSVARSTSFSVMLSAGLPSVVWALPIPGFRSPALLSLAITLRTMAALHPMLSPSSLLVMPESASIP